MDTREEIQHPAIRSAMEYLDMHNVRLTYESDLPAKSGLGTSSSFVVGMLSSFYALKGQYVDKKGWRMRPSTLSGKCAGKQEDGRTTDRGCFRRTEQNRFSRQWIRGASSDHVPAESSS